MKPNIVLTASAVYLALVGLGFIFAPDAMLFGGMGAATVTVVAALRGFGATLFGIGILNWVARNADASKARDAIFLGNTIGFVLTTITIVLGQVGGAPPPGWVFAVINGLFAVAFFVVGKASMSTGAK